MSFVSWHIYGFGIEVSDIKVDSFNKIQNLLKLAPEYEKVFNGWITECGIVNPTLDDLVDFDEDYGLGLATVLKNVILEVEDIELTACDDFEGNQFLLYEPSYPWGLPDKEKDLKEEDLLSLFAKYVSVLTDKFIIVDYYNPENGS